MGVVFFKRCCYFLFAFEILLGIAHILWPEYTWGQGMRSYFNFNESLTLASWLIGIQLLGIGILSLIGFYRERERQTPKPSSTAWVWLIAAFVSFLLFFTEITRIHHRFGLLGYPNPNLYQQMIIFSLSIGLLVLFGWFLLLKLKNTPHYFKFGVGWLISWGALLILARFSNTLSASRQIFFSLITGLTYMFGCTLLLLAVGGYVLQPIKKIKASLATSEELVPFHIEVSQIWILLGLGGATFSLIFLEIILFQMLTISSDYLTANSIVSIALLGSALGGMIGFFTAHRAPLRAMVAASLLLSIAIILVFGISVTLMDKPLLA